MRAIRFPIIAIIGVGALVGLSGCIDPAEPTKDTLAPLTGANPTPTSLSSGGSIPVYSTTTTIAPPPSAVTSEAVTDGSAADSTDVTTAATPSPPVDGEQSYTIQAADTMYKIGSEYGVSAEKIAAFNGWSDGVSHLIIPGQKIRIPPGAKVPTATTEAGSASTASTATAANGATTTTTAGSGGVYVVMANDTLSAIARKVGTTVDAIVAANGWSDGSSHLIIPGQSIKLPAKAG